MNITATQAVNSIGITATQSGNSVILQPVQTTITEIDCGTA